jgi:serine/threonine-protein kinase
MLREIGGRYQVQKKLGAGAWATVYEALDTGAIGRRVAIKVFRLPPPGRRVFGRRGARPVPPGRQGPPAALSHPNIVSVFDYGEDAETAWIVMEMVEGETLKALLDRSGRLPTPVIVKLMGQILDALAYTHSRGVVHRDIKPANIMLTRDQVVKIADFGVARIENSSMTHVGTVLGSPAYMAPEQFRGEDTDHRAGHLGRGRHPLPDAHRRTALRGRHDVRHAEGALRRAGAALAHQGRRAGPSSTPVVSKALAKRPEDRFSSAEEFSKAIRAAAAAAEAPSGRERASLPARRRTPRWFRPARP